MPYDTHLADRLRAQGLRVKETAGWQSRANSSGSSFYPRGAVTHHTAGPHQSSTPDVAPSLGTIINGRPDLPGPLANVYIDFEGTVYVIAAGAANHAGLPDGGSCRGMTGNSSAWGLEIEHPGTVPLPADIAEIAAATQAAVVKGTAGADMVVFHKEWAPSRKIDLATTPTPGAHRQRVGYYLKNAYRPTPEPEPVWPAPVAYAATEQEGPMPPEYVIRDDTKDSDNPGAFYGVYPSGLVRFLSKAERDHLKVGTADGPKAVGLADKTNCNRLNQCDLALRGLVKERK